MQPSPLDAPRFVDDPPLSEWDATVDGQSKQVVAPLRDFLNDLTPIIHEHEQLWPRRVPEKVTEAGPINIQLVRGAVGASNNEWKLVVDGVRCSPRPLENKSFVEKIDGDDTPTCILPSPFHMDGNVSLENINDVRPVMLSVRLEDEALSPEKVEVIVQQVVHCSRRAEKLKDGDSEVIELERINLTPYTLRDCTAHTLTLPYPYSAPRHSTLVISASKQNEIESINAYNKKVDEYNTGLNERLQKLADLRNDAKASEEKRKNARSEYDRLGKKQKIRKTVPSKTVAISMKPDGTEEKTDIFERNYFCVGGINNSAMDALKNILLKVLKAARGWTDSNPGKKPSLDNIKEQLHGSDAALGETQAFLHCLKTGIFSDLNQNPNEMSRMLEKDSGKKLKKDDESSQFVYDLMPHNRRIQSTTRLRYLFQITDHTLYSQRKPVKTIAFEAVRHHAFAAHAVYAGTVSEVKEVHDMLDKFFASIREGDDQNKQVTRGIKELKFVFRSTIPNWPPVLAELYEFVADDATVKLEEIMSVQARALSQSQNEIKRVLPQCIAVTERAMKTFQPASNTSVKINDPAYELFNNSRARFFWLSAGFAVITGIFLAFGAQISDFLKHVASSADVWNRLKDFYEATSLVGALNMLTQGYLFKDEKLASEFLGTGGTVAIGYTLIKPVFDFTTFVWDAIVTRQRNKYGDELIAKIYHDDAVLYAEQKVSMIESCVAAAKTAHYMIQSKGYCGLFKERYYMAEYYNCAEAPRLFKKIKKSRYTNDLWSMAPNSASLSLQPPRDIVDALYEATALRRVPINEVVARMVGTPRRSTNDRPGNFLSTTPSDIFAKSAHVELMNIIKGVRSTYLSGETLMFSAAEYGAEIAQNGAQIIEKIYSNDEYASVVSGDDLVWTCLPGGVAARLALRHVPLLHLDHNHLNVEDRILSISRLALLTEFASSWVTQASAFLRMESKGSTHSIDRALVAREATRSLARVRCLTTDAHDDQKRIAASYAVVSSFSSLLLSTMMNRSGEAEGTKMAPGVEESLDAEQVPALTFEYQDISRPSIIKKASMRLAAWASRRMDAIPMRTWLPTLSVNKTLGINNLVNRMAMMNVKEQRIDLQDDPANDRRNYYCPLGSPIETIPGSVPFDTDALGMRLVWTQSLCKALEMLSVNIFSPDEEKTFDGKIVAAHVPLFGKGEDGILGVTRHPLTLSATDDDHVKVLLSRGSETETREPFTESDELNAQNVKDAAQHLGSTIGLIDKVQVSIDAMRTTAYNTDRLLHALDFVEALGDPAVVRVEVPSYECVLPLGLAMSLQAKYSNSSDDHAAVYVCVSDETQIPRAEALISRALTAATRAVSTGCKAVTLAEACVALS